MSSDQRRIRPLDQDVIDKIAAGEVIQRPRSAIKELIENSLDAGATSINVFVKYTGNDINVLQVKDNGHGINKEDLDAVCQRFAISKLEKFNDLLNVQTFGFRGEALASISHVSNVTVATKTALSQVGYEMKYADGAPISNPKPIPMSTGTTITVEDLFYNNPVRKAALRNLSQEYRMIVELVNLYALDNTHVNFMVKKASSNDPDVRTKAGTPLPDVIRDLFGHKVSKNLLKFTYADKDMNVHVDGMVSDLNANLKVFTFILFINKRLVECQSIRKSMENIYKERLAKGNCSFVFLSMKLNPEHLDVNIHPTKSEVRYLYEDEIGEKLAQTLNNLLEKKTIRIEFNDPARNQSPKQNPTPKASTPKNSTLSQYLNTSTTSNGTSTSKRVTTHVRTQTESQKIGVMFNRLQTSKNIGKNSHRRICKLNSVLQLRNELTVRKCQETRDILFKSSFVGCSKDTGLHVFLQKDTNLYVMDYEKFSEELFYSLFLDDFMNFGFIVMSEPLPIIELAKIYLEKFPSTDSNFISAKTISDKICGYQEMFDDYFALKIEDKKLVSLPLLIDGHQPDLRKLPTFIFDLATKVDFTDESECFKTFGEALAKFYSPLPIVTDLEHEKFALLMECTIFPILCDKFLPSRKLKGFLRPVGSVTEFYKVFHRC